MQKTLFYIVNMALFVGAGFLCVSLFPIQRLVNQMPQGPLKKRWNDLRALIFFFIMGYIGFTVLYWIGYEEGFLHLIAPAVFFFGAVFVLFVGTLALQTATEIKTTAVLQQENITDHLIGINNRRYLDKKLIEEIARAQRYKLPLSFILLDVDHFKNINDTHGHPVGDRVLRSLGKLLFKKVRDTDVIARYGGEEIAILAVQTSVAAAADFAERLRFAVEKSPMTPAISITVSIGVAGLDGKVQDSSELVKRADKALYDAKQAGRNKVVTFDPQRDSL